VAGGDFVAELLDGFRARANPDDAGLDDGTSEVGVFG
jgi:hypothetical protein